MSQLGSQELAVGTFQKHLLQRKQKTKTRRRTLLVALTLTSMVDMFSLLVIFLLQTFSTSPDLVMVSKGVTLPASISSTELEDSPVLAISSEAIYLDQKFVGKTNDILIDPTPLMGRLQKLREQWQRSHPKSKFNGVISLQADRNLPSTMVSQVMGMLPTQSYSTVQLAVLSRGGT